MKKWTKIAGAVLVGPLLLLQSGCMTRALWTGQLTETFNSPSAPTRLALFDVPDRGDVLVQYDELGPWHDRPHVRRFLVNDNEERLQLGKEPIFVTSLPVEARPLETNPRMPRTEMWAKVSANGMTFTICRADGRCDGPFSLPTYHGTTGKAKMLVMTPLTVGVDSTIIGGVLGCCFVYGLFQSGGSLRL